MSITKKFTSNAAAIAVAAATTMLVSGCATYMDKDQKPAMTADVPMVGGAAMFPTKNIVENAVNSKDHTTLVAAVTAAGLVEALSGPGPFTVFAPTDAAFAKLQKKWARNHTISTKTRIDGRAPDDHVLLTCFLGGVRHPELGTASAETLVKLVQPELAGMLGVSAAPTFVHLTTWPRAIPQYALGHEANGHAAERIEALVRSHQTLLANASHELRSPLARLKGNATTPAASRSSAAR
jgi:hypothetical protein